MSGLPKNCLGFVLVFFDYEFCWISIPSPVHMSRISVDDNDHYNEEHGHEHVNKNTNKKKNKNNSDRTMNKRICKQTSCLNMHEDVRTCMVS